MHIKRYKSIIAKKFRYFLLEMFHSLKNYIYMIIISAGPYKVSVIDMFCLHWYYCVQFLKTQNNEEYGTKRILREFLYYENLGLLESRATASQDGS